jgi:hypothetical protein
MPRLPSAQDFGAVPSVRPLTGAVTYNPNTGTESLQARSFGRLGETLERVSEQIERTQVRNDTARAEDSLNLLIEKKLDLTNGDDGFAKKRGSEAVTRPLFDDYAKRFDQSVSEINESLKNDRQKNLFLKRAEMARLQFKQDLVNHVSRETDIYHKSVYLATLDLESRNAIDRYKDPNGVALSLERINAAISSEADRNRLTESEKESIKAKIYSSVNRGIIERHLANDDDLSAMSFYEQNSGLISGEDQIAVEKMLETGSTRGRAQRFADSVQSKGLPEAEAIKLARSTFEGKQEEAAVLEIRSRAREQKEAVANDQADAADKAWDILAKTKSLSTVPIGVLNRMDGKVRIALEREAQNIAAGVGVKTDPNVYYDLKIMAVKEPERFQSTDLRQFFPSLDEADREHFINLQHPDKIKEAATLEQQLANMHDQMKWGSGDKEKKGRFDRTITLAIDDAQREKGKPLNYKERQELIDRMVISGEVLSGKFYLPDPNKRLYEIYGTEDAKRFSPDIPKDERQKIESALKRKGVKVTEEEVVRLFKAKYKL